MEEDNLLFSGWLNTTLDPITGNNQSKEAYWARIDAYFRENRGVAQERNRKSLSMCWVSIQKEVSKFTGAYDQMCRLHPNGMNDHDMIEAAKQLYKSTEGKDFLFMHCWVLLRGEEKWKTYRSMKRTGKKQKTVPGSSPGTSNAVGGSNDGDNDAVPAARPPGRKQSKARERMSRTDSSFISSPNSEFVDQWWAKKDVSDAKRSQMFDILVAAEERSHRLAEEAIATHKAWLQLKEELIAMQKEKAQASLLRRKKS